MPVKSHPAFKPCPCGSKRSFHACCQPFLQGARAPTAEQLMRSRYTAYVLHDADYLLYSWHATTRPEALDFSDDTTVWESLKVHHTTHGQPEDREGTVHFTAKYKLHGQKHTMQENSRFLKVDGEWKYLDGELH
ncbi:YchJ family protein [Deinococcus misasensis]|uniref:YchJ family protein n=1 Tax=Deinococcus misasensis TaxID=392413 RepID=UPI000558BC20|nr:YchJ family metal-binding protein [Deinococcus misasensis]